MLAYYLTWHLREAWAPLLFKDEHPPIAADPVAKADRSPAAQRKAQTKRTANGEPCHSYRSLIAELATQTRNTIRLPDTPATFDKLTQPTPLQARALDLAATRPSPRSHDQDTPPSPKIPTHSEASVISSGGTSA